MGDGIENMVHRMAASLTADEGLEIFDRVNTISRATEAENTYIYTPFVFIVVNSVLVLFSAFKTVLGALTLLENGIAGDYLSSTCLRTTRRSTLDRELRGGSLRGSSFRKKFGDLNPNFGELLVKESYRDGIRHVDMRVEAGVRRLKKGRDYY